jgi:hypothetical protein
MLPPVSRIRAATVSEVDRSSGYWVFVDLGFASTKESCGLLKDDEHKRKARTLTFSQLQSEIISICSSGSVPLNLLLEAPLSVAFGPHGNPVGRSMEKRKKQTRYWYVGLGSIVMVAATYLLRSIHDLSPKREIRLFEGLVSFKKKGGRSSHTKDVIQLRDLAWGSKMSLGRIIAPGELSNEGDRVVSAFRVAGMDFGVPPVVAIGG